MSSAFYPLGMNSMPSSGYNHGSTYFNKKYIPWKGTGINSVPVGTASGNIRPLTNNDSGNVFPTGFGLPRPIKHFRKGRVIPVQPISVTGLSHQNAIEVELINYNMNRYVASSKGTSVGSGLLNDMQDNPGSYSVKQNQPNQQNNCQTCEGIPIVATFQANKLNKTYLTDNPEQNSTTPPLCCNNEYKAKRRSIYASTNIKKNYYTTSKQYLQNRCKTFEQKSFNFMASKDNLPNNIYQANPYYEVVNGASKPGSPGALSNTYLANCQPNAEIFNATENALITQMISIMFNINILTQGEINTFNSLNINTISGFFTWLNSLPEPQKATALNIFTQFINNPYTGMPLSGPANSTGCQLTVYKPNNYQYAKQGAVDSSTRNLKLNVDTISTNAASIQNYNNTGQFLVSANELYAGNDNNMMNLYKNKAPTCKASIMKHHQNKKICL